jgi:hypothetical protein
MEEDAPLELDLEKAGLHGKKHGQSMPGEPAPAEAREEPAAEPAPAPPVASPPAEEPLRSAAPGLPGQASPAPRPDRVRLLGEDVVTAALLAAAIGLIAGLLVANESVRRAERDRLEPLRMELEQVVERPLAARAGEIRTSRAVKNDLAAAHDETRKNFFVMWLLTALPIGGGLFLIKRSA